MEKLKVNSCSEISPSVIAILEQFLNTKYDQWQYKYQIQEATKKGDNYMGVIYRVTITLINNNNNVKSIILKIPPANVQPTKRLFARAGFLRESLAYKEFLTLVNCFQNSKDLAVNKHFFEYPECYFTSTEDFNETICMNDLQTEGFFMHDRFEPLNLDQVSYVMEVYAKLHATSLAIKDQDPDKLSNLKNISDIFEQRKDDVKLNDFFESLKQIALETVDNTNDIAYLEKLKEYFNRGTFYKLMLTLLDSRSSEPYSVICHGDCWINNIMFKQKNGKVVDIRFIDWQLMRYSSPITDIMYFMMLSTTREFRQQHFKEIIDIYYCAARKHIIRLGSDPEKIYSRCAFEKEFKNKGAIGLFFSVIVLPVITIKREDVPKFQQLNERASAGQSTDTMENSFTEAKSTLFGEKMRGIIIDLIDWNLI